MDRVDDLGWGALLLGISFHVLRLLAVSRAWQNIIAAAYPGKEIRWRSIVAAVFAGVGINAIVPARGGEVVRIFLAKRSVEDSSYATVTSTLLLLGVFDFVLAGSLVIWAGLAGFLPGLDKLGPSFDFGWAVDNPRGAVIGVLVVLAILLAVLLWFAEQIGDFKQRIAQGFAALRDFRFYLRRVALWQAVDWSCRLVAVLFFLSAFGLPATLHNALLVQVSAGLASLLPISPGGIGTEQAFLLYLFSGQVSELCAPRVQRRHAADADGGQRCARVRRDLPHVEDGRLARARCAVAAVATVPRYSSSVPDDGPTLDAAR